MGRYIVILAVITLGAVVVSAQDAAYQQGLSVHNQQIQEHLRKEQEQQRNLNLFGGSFPQQNYQQQYQQPAPQQYNNINQYSNNYARSSNPEQEYQEGLKAHQQQIQAHLAKEAQFQPQHHLTGAADPAYQLGLQAHQQQLQAHLAQEQQHGGPASSYQAPQSYHQPGPATPGLQAHMQQLLEHQRREQQHQAQVGQATQYHASHYSPPQQSNYNNNNNYYQPPQQSYQPRRNFQNQNGGKVSLASLGF